MRLLGATQKEWMQKWMQIGLAKQTWMPLRSVAAQMNAALKGGQDTRIVVKEGIARQAVGMWTASA